MPAATRSWRPPDASSARPSATRIEPSGAAGARSRAGGWGGGAPGGGSDSGRPADFSFSAGVSAFPDPSPDGPRLFRQADAALYWSKRHGRTDVQVFDPARHGAAGDPRTTPELEAAVADVARRMAPRPAHPAL